jgi:hypothetical protein
VPRVENGRFREHRMTAFRQLKGRQARTARRDRACRSLGQSVAVAGGAWARCAATAFGRCAAFRRRSPSMCSPGIAEGAPEPPALLRPSPMLTPDSETRPLPAQATVARSHDLLRRASDRRGRDPSEEVRSNHQVSAVECRGMVLTGLPGLHILPPLPRHKLSDPGGHDGPGSGSRTIICRLRPPSRWPTQACDFASPTAVTKVPDIPRC